MSPLVSGRDAADVVGDDAGLFVGGPCQRDHSSVSEDEILHFDDIPGCVDIGISGLHMIIYDDTAACVELKACILRNLAVGAHANGEDDNVSGQDSAAAEFDIHRRALVLEGGNAVCKVQAYTVAADIVVQDFGHLGIYGRHDLVCSFDDGNAEAGVVEIFRHFKADKTASDDDRALCPEPADQFADVVGIRNGPKGQNARRVNSRNAGAKR